MSSIESRVAPPSPRPKWVWSVAIYLAATALMGFLRLYVYRDQVLTLAFGLPLLVCLWHKDRRLLWAMAATFILMSTVKFFFLMPLSTPGLPSYPALWAMQVINIGVIGIVVHSVINLTERLESKNAALSTAYAEIESQAEALASQNEELQQQGEELAQQNEELQQQTGELEQQSEQIQAQAELLRTNNQELEEREAVLGTILESLRHARDEREILTRVCEMLVKLMGPQAAAAAVLERAGSELVVHAQAGSVSLAHTRWPWENSFAAVVIHHDRSAYIDDLDARPDLTVPQPSEGRFRSVLSAPLRRRGECVGLVEIFSCQPQHWTEPQFQMIEWVAAQCAIVLELMQTGQALRESEARLRRSQEIAHLGSWELDVLNDYLFWSDETYRIFGLRPQQFGATYEAFLERVHPEDRAAVDAAYSNSLREQKAGYEIEHRVVQDGTGEVRWVYEKCAHFHDAAGRIVRSLGMVLDITERKQAEGALKHTQQRFKLLAEISARLLRTDFPEEIIGDLCRSVMEHLGCDCFINYLADSAHRRLRLHAAAGFDDVAGGPVEDLEYGRAVCGCAAHDRAPLGRADLVQCQHPNQALVQQLGLRAYACQPLFSQGRVRGTLAFGSRTRGPFTLEELSLLKSVADQIALALQRVETLEALRGAKDELVRLNEALEGRVKERTAKLEDALGELEHFSYAITHDMRAPLRTMRGFGDILYSECADCTHHQRRDYLRRIVIAAGRMDQLITDALNYAKVVQNEQNLAPIDTTALLQGILESYPHLHPPDAQVYIEGSLPHILGNEAGLTQCFSNLLSNAVKFVTPGKTPEVRIRAETRDGRARFWFEDNGIGISPEHQERIWGMFQRVDKNYDGTGIGLALVRKMVERMNGQAGVESVPGEGSRFWVELKLAESTPPTAIPP